jgi:hypothetical protein
MAADIIAFSMGFDSFTGLSEYEAAGEFTRGDPGARSDSSRRSAEKSGGALGRSPLTLGKLLGRGHQGQQNSDDEESHETSQVSDAAYTDGQQVNDSQDDGHIIVPTTPAQRVVTVVSPSRDLSYALALATQLGADTVNADFGQFQGGDVLKSASKWIDLSDSETIWRSE